MRIFLITTGFLLLFGEVSVAQHRIYGEVRDEAGAALPFAHIVLDNGKQAVVSDTLGRFEISSVAAGTHKMEVSYVGYSLFHEDIKVNGSMMVMPVLKSELNLEDVVITGTMIPVSKTESPVPVEVYSPTFFRKNPTPSIFESLQNVNGVRPQLNCNVCNTGDIHINGLEGPYTMVLIDGMPIVSGLSTVYGLSGIPNSMIERVEIVKGPASSLYGSEAIGGIINIITKSPESHPLVSVEFQTTSWMEKSLDLGVRTKVGKKAQVLTGVHLFDYHNPRDLNGDNFTDIAISRQVSVFQKWSFKRKHSRMFNIAGRYYHENRWGGEMQWTPEFRGGDNIYGESIYTRRVELLSNYALPFKENLRFSTSMNGHLQDAAYGTTPFLASQYIGFGQLTWYKEVRKHVIVSGLSSRYTYYDDNTTATAAGPDTARKNVPSRTFLPGVFVQDEISFARKQTLLLGGRFDRHPVHGPIITPRLAYKIKLNTNHVFRFNAGTGFRVVNVFTEDHAALTGARQVVIEEDLRPERSYNANANYVRKFFSKSGNSIGWDVSIWYSRFTNKILANYDANPDLILYENLKGYSESKGVTVNLDAHVLQYIRCNAGITYLDMSVTEDRNGVHHSYRPVLTENWTGTWSMTFTHPKLPVSLDYTGNLYGPMRLPLLGPQDPRPAYSPWWSIQNVQCSYLHPGGNFTVFAGVKNFLNFTPAANAIARPQDPFDKQVERDAGGQVIATANNPNALTFDPSYVYAPNQGIRFFIGLRWNLESLPK